MIIGLIVCFILVFVSICAGETCKDDDNWRVVCVFILYLVYIAVGTVWINIEGHHSANESYGIPITMTLHDFNGKNFTPQAFIVTAQHTLVYDYDGKVYALDGIKLEDGLKPETLTVGTNVSYTVYTKAGQLFFGRLEPPKPEKS